MKPKSKGAYEILKSHAIYEKNNLRKRLTETAGLDLDKIHRYSTRLEEPMIFDLSDLFGSHHEKHPLFQKLVGELVIHNKMVSSSNPPSIYKEHILRQLKKMLKECVCSSDKKSIDNDLNRIYSWFRFTNLNNDKNVKETSNKELGEKSSFKSLSPNKGKLAESTLMNRPGTSSSNNYVSTRPQTSSSAFVSSFAFTNSSKKNNEIAAKPELISQELLVNHNDKMQNEVQISFGNYMKPNDSVIDNRLQFLSQKDSKQKNEDKEFIGIMKAWGKNKSQQSSESNRTREGLLTSSKLSSQPKVFIRKSRIYNSLYRPNFKGPSFEEDINKMRTKDYRNRKEMILGKAKENSDLGKELSLSSYSKSTSIFKPLSLYLPSFNPQLKAENNLVQEIDQIKRSLEAKGLDLQVDTFVKAMQRPATSHFTGMPFAGRSLQSNPFVKEERKKKNK